MGLIAFDTQAFVKRLTDVGMPERQAGEQARLIEGELATKRDLKELEARLEGRMTETKAKILKWMFAALLGQTAILAALVKLL